MIQLYIWSRTKESDSASTQKPPTPAPTPQPCVHQLRTHHAMGLAQTANKDYWRNVGCFRVFLMLFGVILPRFLGRGTCLILKYQNSPTCNKFLFQGEMSLWIVSELFQHVPVHPKCLPKLWLWWEQFCPCGAKNTKIVYFHLDLSRERKGYSHEKHD